MNSTMYNVVITPTIPTGRELLTMECKERGVDKTTLKPLDPKQHFMVIIKGNPKNGIIRMKPENFIRKYWEGKELKDPALDITFVGWIFTIKGSITDLVEWAKSFT
jgi:hypothetical protein